MKHFNFSLAFLLWTDKENEGNNMQRNNDEPEKSLYVFACQNKELFLDDPEPFPIYQTEIRQIRKMQEIAVSIYYIVFLAAFYQGKGWQEQWVLQTELIFHKSNLFVLKTLKECIQVASGNDICFYLHIIAILAV